MKQRADTYVVTHRKLEEHCIKTSHHFLDLEENYEHVEFKSLRDAKKFAESWGFACLHAQFPVFENTLSAVFQSGSWHCNRTSRPIRALKKHLHTPVWEVEPSYLF